MSLGLRVEGTMTANSGMLGELTARSRCLIKACGEKDALGSKD